MTSPGPDWVEQARRFVISSGLVEALAAGRPPGAADPGTTDPGTTDPGTSNPDGPADADHAADCRWCPLCAGLAALRGRRPDLVEGLADLLTTAATVLRASTAPPAEADPDGRVPAEPVEEEPERPAPPPVQRIDVA